MKALVFSLALAVLGAVGAQAADQNLFVATGTLSSCGCVYYSATADWVCQTVLSMDGPAPHFSPEAPSVPPVELTGQSLGQCSALTLPRHVQALFFTAPAGIDYVHGLVRTPIKIYFLIDLGV